MKKWLPCLLTVLITSHVYSQVISEIDLENSKVELVNNTVASIDLTGYRWCNRVNGNPFYPGVSASDIDAVNSTDNSLVIQPGGVLVFQLTSDFLPVSGGELGLYLPTGSFGSRAALVDYVNYGTSVGVRDSAAAGAPAIWEANTSVDLSGSGAGDTIQLIFGEDGDSVKITLSHLERSDSPSRSIR